ncbi:histidine kinase dimerization/phospho-acceptor domain-containing protein [Paraburkholderia sp. BR10937]|uniref:histidine kinase dimerization/phospho-acceptor domain-containing protein n=1 Tax=Paraburkholderia sp. BR10937 TaxID=3236994 RepID=UPI0034D22CCF
MKDHFPATLAHERRNPLAPIRNGLQILRASPDPADGKHVLDMLDRQLGHLVRLVPFVDLDMPGISSSLSVSISSPPRSRLRASADSPLLHRSPRCGHSRCSTVFAQVERAYSMTHPEHTGARSWTRDTHTPSRARSREKRSTWPAACWATPPWAWPARQRSYMASPSRP